MPNADKTSAIVSTKRSIPTPQNTSPNYVGRFAPSPTGPLHFGSLTCALASYLDARANGGRWLVRVEDIDPPREQAGATDDILKSLSAHGLHWNGELLQQSDRDQAYRTLLKQLEEAQLSYRCNCTRRRLRALGGIYDGHCRRHPPPLDEPAAIRLKVAQLPADARQVNPEITFIDAVQGPQYEDLRRSCGDFIIHRKDGRFSYQLAVVADDIFQGITHVLRGSDLLHSTARQIFLFSLLGQTAPQFIHIPVLVDEQQQKLSKQAHAPAVKAAQATDNLWQASRCLGMNPPESLRQSQPQELLQWTIENWQLQKVPRQLSIPSS